MLKCPYCKRVTEKGEPTAHFFTYAYKNPQRKEDGKKIFTQVKCCYRCKGEVLFA